MSLTKVSYSMINGTPYNVLDFGAKGDGVTDDAAAINAAFQAALTTGDNGEVLFPIGTYLVKSPITIIDRPGMSGQINIKIKGLGPAGNAKGYYPGTYQSALIKADASFSGAYVLGYIRSPGVYAFQGIEIENISIDTGNYVDYGIQIDNPVGVTMNSVNAFNAKITNIYLNAVDGDGFNVNLTDIYLWGGTPAQVTTPTQYGINSNARYAMYNRVVMDGCQTGIKAAADNVIITNCHLEGSLTSIDISTTGGGLARVTNNFIFPYGVGSPGWAGSTTGVKCYGSGGGSALFNTVANNTIWSTQGTNPAGVVFNNSFNNTIISNVFYGTSDGACINIDANGNTIVDSNQFNTADYVIYNVGNYGNIVYTASNQTFGSTYPKFNGYVAYINNALDYLSLGAITSSGQLLVKNTANTNMIALTGNSYQFSVINGYNVDASYNTANAALKIGKNVGNSRSINAGGTVNASGADYAEYMEKSGDFTIQKGDICGIDSKGKLTNLFADSVSFVVKSTNPSLVGGDTWGTDPEGNPLPDIEEKRAKVDRIAFAGQVPVNVQNAVVGGYIIPANTNGFIVGQCVFSPTFEQYQLSVGKVVSINPDGKPQILVKVA